MASRAESSHYLYKWNSKEDLFTRDKFGARRIASTRLRAEVNYASQMDLSTRASSRTVRCMGRGGTVGRKLGIGSRVNTNSTFEMVQAPTTTTNTVPRAEFGEVGSSSQNL